MAALLEEVVTILGPIRRDSYEGQTGHKVGIRAAQTKVFEDFTITEKAPTESASWHFQPEEGPSP